MLTQWRITELRAEYDDCEYIFGSDAHNDKGNDISVSDAHNIDGSNSDGLHRQISILNCENDAVFQAMGPAPVRACQQVQNDGAYQHKQIANQSQALSDVRHNGNTNINNSLSNHTGSSSNSSSDSGFGIFEEDDYDHYRMEAPATGNVIGISISQSQDTEAPKSQSSKPAVRRKKRHFIGIQKLFYLYDYSNFFGYKTSLRMTIKMKNLWTLIPIGMARLY